MCPLRFVFRQFEPGVRGRYILQWWDGVDWADIPLYFERVTEEFEPWWDGNRWIAVTVATRDPPPPEVQGESR